MRKIQRGRIRWAVCLLLSVLLLMEPAAAEAAKGAAAKEMPDYELGVRCDRQITALNEQQRSFRLEYQVWCEDWVTQEAQPCQVILLLEASPESLETSGLARLRTSMEEFLTEFSRLSPRSQVGLVIFGGESIRTTPLTSLDSSGVETLTRAISQAEVETKGQEKLTAALSQATGETRKNIDYAEALRQAQDLAGQNTGSGEAPLYLITLTDGSWWEEGTEALTELQVLRGLGARSYTISLCDSPEQEAEDFWQSMASSPLSTHHYLCAGEPGGCLSQIRRDVAAVLSVEVVERLDPRFTLTQSEQIRLRRAGAHLTPGRDGAWEISWEVPLPRDKQDPWRTSLTVQARAGFPGGNDIPVDREGSGVYRAGDEILPFPEQCANVPLALRLKDFTIELFLGERVKTVYQKKNLEELLFATPAAEWFGKGKTGDFTYFWERSQGDAIGTLKQLGALRPEQDEAYRLRVTYRPDSKGLLAAGKPVEAMEKSALLHVKLTSGTLRIRAVAGDGASGEGIKLDRNSSLLFQIKGDNGVGSFCTARLEADPQGAADPQVGVFLEGEITGLPFGVYTVLPVSGTGLNCMEEYQICRLGCWEQDDTVSPRRDLARAQFVLREE